MYCWFVHDRVRAFGLVLVLLLVTSCSPRGQARDLDGAAIDPLAAHDAITVLVFVSSECPISNRYAPELKRIAAAHAASGVRFWLVYPDARDDAAKVRAHIQAFDYGMRALRDPEHALVKRAGARVTPEVAVFGRGGEVAYRGRIDDRYVRFGDERPTAQVHDLEDALRAVLQGQAVQTAVTTAVGCAISE